MTAPMPALRGVEGIAMKDDYYLMEPPPVEAVEACPCCGSSARVWVYSEDPTMPVTRVVMCDHSDSIGPRDSLVYEGCLLQMPPDEFYRETGRDAVRYWNEYAKALTAAQRANRWNTSQVLRGPQSDIAAAAHAQGLRERISELEAQRQWQPIETAPMDGQKVILFYLNRNNFRRTVMARWVTDEQAAETDADDVGLEAGWYECIDNWDDYCQVCIHEGEPTHWMPLPALPESA